MGEPYGVLGASLQVERVQHRHIAHVNTILTIEVETV